MNSLNGHLYAVFSASNYCGSVGNKSIVLLKKKNAKMEIHQFPPLPRYARPGNDLTTQAFNQTQFWRKLIPTREDQQVKANPRRNPTQPPSPKRQHNGKARFKPVKLAVDRQNWN